MRRKSWESYQYYPKYTPSHPKEVEDGLKLKAQRGMIGEHWWSKRWLEVLYSFNMGARLDRGRTYARKGQVMSLEIQIDGVHAKVQGSARRPYEVTMQLEHLRPAVWDRVLQVLSAQALFMAELLAGEMPVQMESLFIQEGIALFPSFKRDLITRCDCPDSANPCKHIGAVYFLLAEKLDEDPFILFLLRGMTKENLMAQLRQVWEASGEPEEVPLTSNSPAIIRANNTAVIGNSKRSSAKKTTAKKTTAKKTTAKKTTAKKTTAKKTTAKKTTAKKTTAKKTTAKKTTAKKTTAKKTTAKKTTAKKTTAKKTTAKKTTAKKTTAKKTTAKKTTVNHSSVNKSIIEMDYSPFLHRFWSFQSPLGVISFSNTTTDQEFSIFKQLGPSPWILQDKNVISYLQEFYSKIRKNFLKEQIN